VNFANEKGTLKGERRETTSFSPRCSGAGGSGFHGGRRKRKEKRMAVPQVEPFDITMTRPKEGKKAP